MNTAKLVDGDKTRRKRLKVVSACGECRRKKTKCNGEKPCAGCLKAHVECKYVFTQKANPITTTLTSIPSSVVTSKTLVEEKLTNKTPSSSSSSSSSTTTTTTTATTSTLNTTSIESIEERLGTIENILRALLGSGKNKHLLQGLQQQQQQQANNHFFQQHSDSLCGDMYSSSTSPHLVHAPHTQNRCLPREKRKRHEQDEKDEKDEQGVTETKRLIRDDFGHGYQYNNKLQLAPIKIINNQQQHSSSPGTPTIKNLLNEDDTTRWYPQPQPKSSAFFRMSSPRLPNDIINTNSATTAAGSSS